MSFIRKFISRKFLPKTLLVRFILIIIIPVLIGQFFALHLFYKRHWYNVASHTSSVISVEINELINKVRSEPRNTEKKYYLNLSYSFERDATLPSGQPKLDEELHIFKDSLERRINTDALVRINNDDKIEVLIQVGEDLLFITFLAKLLLNPTTYIFVIWVVFLTVILLSVSLIFSKNQIRSILELAEAAKAYGSGRKDYYYKPSGAREIRKAGLAFLKMRDRIERQTAKRTQMLAMISHDLKTPLTRMKLQVELMEDSEEKDELEYDIKTMQHMIDSYLDFARGEGGEDFIEHDFNLWIAKYLEAKWSKQRIKLIKSKEQIIVQIKPHSFGRAISNVISNAIKYSTKIKISVYSEEQNAVIAIEDNGVGIKDELKKKVLKPFYRCDESRSPGGSHSVGLGLAITKEIAIGHYGSIFLGDSKTLGGLMVKIKIPKIN